jgi:hypothetical protein
MILKMRIPRLKVKETYPKSRSKLDSSDSSELQSHGHSTTSIDHLLHSLSISFLSKFESYLGTLCAKYCNRFWRFKGIKECSDIQKAKKCDEGKTTNSKFNSTL